MPTTCVVCGYRNVAGDGIKTHRFPPSEVLKKKWLETCCLKYAEESERICSQHFLDHDYASPQKDRLKPGAIPSIFSWNVSKSRKRLAPRDRSRNDSSDDSLLSTSSSMDTSFNLLLHSSLPSSNLSFNLLNNQILPDGASSPKKKKMSPSKEELKSTIAMQKRKIKTLNQRLRRKEKKITNLKEMYKELSEKNCWKINPGKTKGKFSWHVCRNHHKPLQKQRQEATGTQVQR